MTTIFCADIKTYKKHEELNHTWVVFKFSFNGLMRGKSNKNNAAINRTENPVFFVFKKRLPFRAQPLPYTRH